MRKRVSSHEWAVVQALFVTFLWATSWVFIKIGLQDIPPLLFAGLRYSLAFLSLLPLFARRARVVALRALTWRDWRRLLLLGVLYYAVTQGAQFVGLLYLPSVTVSLLLNFTTVAVALLGVLFLAEQPTWLQWSGVALSLAGALLYFYPVALPPNELFGISI
ncbi:MAG: DMT family transporter, partial [Ardenticatenaceae bacterium]